MFTIPLLNIKFDPMIKFDMRHLIPVSTSRCQNLQNPPRRTYLPKNNAIYLPDSLLKSSKQNSTLQQKISHITYNNKEKIALPALEGSLAACAASNTPESPATDSSLTAADTDLVFVPVSITEHC